MGEKNCYGLILAGGRGTRFWPRSRRSHPKQLLSFLGEKSLLQQTVERLRPVLPPERLWVLTNELLRDRIIRQLPEVPRRQIVAEPVQRNTAPCIGLGAQILESLDPDAVMGVFPADHVISKPSRYIRMLRGAFRAADKGKMVVLGVQARWPETGYGYIEFPKDTQPGSLTPSPVVQFCEKPGPRTAKRFVSEGNFYWNAGMFFWRADVFQQALREHLPKTATILASLPPLSRRTFRAELRHTYPLCENVSVDYAVLEKARGVVGLAADDFGWNDVGSWDAVYELLAKDGRKNVAQADALIEASSGNYVEASGKLVALLGVQDLIVVDTPDALLVADRKQAQRVGELVKTLAQRKREDLL